MVSNEGVIEDCSATGSVSGEGQYVGGLVGFSDILRIRDSYATGSVFGTGDYIGGLAGRITGGNIDNSYSASMVTGKSNVGGFMGYTLSAAINNSYATGSVSGESDVGGFIGRITHSFSAINNSYATGLVSGTGDGIGGLVGSESLDPSITNSYYAAIGRNNGLGEEHIFAQLRCPTAASATCSLSDSGERTYRDWDTGVWDFGSATDLPQLFGNRNSELNRKPYIKGSAKLVVRMDSTGTARLTLEADYPGPPGESVTFTWSLSGVPPLLHHLVYFVDPAKDTTGTEVNGSVVTLVIVGNGGLAGLAGESFDVELTNSIFDNVDRLPVLVGNPRPMVVGGREQTRTIQDSSSSATLKFSATDPDSPDSGGAGLSWDFFSRDGIAEGSTVVFSGTTKGGTVKVEVRRSSLDPVGSFVLEVASPAGERTTFTVTIKTVCSPELGVDLVAGQKGMGTQEDPYQIKRLCQLQDVRSNPGAYYGLVKTIDASETKDWNEGAGFEPIASFSGSFVNESNYVISSLTISRSTESNVGLFSVLAEGATIRDVILVGSRMTGLNGVGLLVGYSLGVIEGCSATGSVSGVKNVGGLVGSNHGFINNSYVTGSVSGSGDNVGGLVGGSHGFISNSYATGSVSGGSDNVGGLAGNNGEGASISRSYAASTVTGTDLVGGLVGESLGSISNSYAASTVTGINDVGGLVGRNKEGASISRSHADSRVEGGNNVGGLVGYQAASSVTDSYATGSVSGVKNVGGLVGSNHGFINNSYVTGSVSGSGDNVGGLVGGSHGFISNSYATGSVSGGSDNVGGLAGNNGEGASISRSYAASTVTGTDLVGGLVGESLGSISNSYAASTVTGVNDVGGLVGRNKEGASISRSHADSRVEGGNNVGGLVGYQAASSVTDSYATGSVSGVKNVGGLVGFHGIGSIISNTYAVSTVSTVTGTTTRIGGLVGFSEGGEDSIASSYHTYTGQENSWGEIRTSEQLACPTALGAAAGGTCGLPAVTYAGWSEGVWNFGRDDELPTLRLAGGDIFSAMSLRVRVYLGGAVR